MVLVIEITQMFNFLNPRHLLKFTDLVYVQTAQIMYKAKNNLLPANIQQLFFNREGRYNIRGQCNFKQLCNRITLKSFFCIDMWSEVVEQVMFSS